MREKAKKAMVNHQVAAAVAEANERSALISTVDNSKIIAEIRKLTTPPRAQKGSTPNGLQCL